MPRNFNTPKGFDWYGFIDFVKEHTGMYFPEKKISHLYYYLDGYITGFSIAKLPLINNTPDFRYFSTWIAGRIKSGYGLSAAWCWHLLKHYGSEEKAFVAFFNHLDEYRNVKPEISRQEVSGKQHPFLDNTNKKHPYFAKTKWIYLMTLKPGFSYWVALVNGNNKILNVSRYQGKPSAIKDIQFNFNVSKKFHKIPEKDTRRIFLKISNFTK